MLTRNDIQRWEKFKEKASEVDCDGEKILYFKLPVASELEDETAIVEELLSLVEKGETITEKEQIVLNNYLQRLKIRHRQIEQKSMLLDQVRELQTMKVPLALLPLKRKVARAIPRNKIVMFEGELAKWESTVIKAISLLEEARYRLIEIADDRDWPEDKHIMQAVCEPVPTYAEPLFTWAVSGFNVLDPDILSVLEINVVMSEMPEFSQTLEYGQQLMDEVAIYKGAINQSKEMHAGQTSDNPNKATRDDAINVCGDALHLKFETLTTAYEPVSASGGHVSTGLIDEMSSTHSSSLASAEIGGILSPLAQNAVKRLRAIVKQLRRMDVNLSEDQDSVYDKFFREKILLFSRQMTETEVLLDEDDNIPKQAGAWIEECDCLISKIGKLIREADKSKKTSEANDRVTELSSKNLPEFSGQYSGYITWKRRTVQALDDSRQPKRNWKLIVSTSCFKKCIGKSQQMINRIVNENSDWDFFLYELDSEFWEPTVIANIMMERIQRIRKPFGDEDPQSIEMSKTVTAADAELDICGVKEMVCQSLLVEGLFAKLPPKIKDYVAERRHLKRPVDVWNLIVEGFKEKRGYLMGCRQNYYTLHGNADQFNKFEKRNQQVVKVKTSSVETKENGPSHSGGKPRDPCPLCEGPHAVWSHLCKMIGQNLTPDTVGKLLSLNICLRCGRKKSECNERCNGKYKTKDGRLKSSDCNVCKEKVHFRLCKCNYEKEKGSTKTACVTIEKHEGDSTTPLVETIELRDPVTEEITQAIIQYDTGSQRSWIQNNFILTGEYEKSEFLRVEGFAGAGTCAKEADTFSYHVKAEDKYHVIELTKFDDLTGVQKTITMIPSQWKEKFSSDFYQTPASPVDVLLGFDHSGLFPKLVDQKKHLGLYQSQITGKMLIGGSTREHKTVQCKPVKTFSNNEKHEAFMSMLTCENLDLSNKGHAKQMEKQDIDLYASLEHK